MNYDEITLTTTNKLDKSNISVNKSSNHDGKHKKRSLAKNEQVSNEVQTTPPIKMQKQLENESIKYIFKFIM